MWIYLGLLCLLLILVARRYRGNRGQRRLKLRIFQAIYSNPTLKAMLEKELGESVGSVPPVSSHVLRFMSEGGRSLRRKIACARRVQMAFFAFLLVLVFVAPFWVLPICIVLSAVRVALLCCASAPVRECTCCCCGASTEHAANGTLTQEQACCGCCKGTGVCAPGCADCCGPSGCCCCEDGKCSGDCCDGNGAGCCVDNQVVVSKCCGCCSCCGATADAAKNGTLTEAQLACCCCCGTGCCTSSTETGCCCCCCCDGSSSSTKPTVVKGRGQKHIFQPSFGVYQGIPVQVV